MSLRSPLFTLLATATVVATAGSALAHTQVDVADGRYEILVGWVDEPPYAGLKNGLDLGVYRYVDGDDHRDDGGHAHGDNDTHAAREKVPVSGLVANLTVTYEIAGETFTPPEFRARHGQEGRYTAEITPTREGEYTVHIVGNIEGHPIDVKVKPHTIESTAPTMFPQPDLTPEEVTMKIAKLEATLDAMEAQSQSETPPTPVETGNETPAAGALVAALAAVGVALVARKRK